MTAEAEQRREATIETLPETIPVREAHRFDTKPLAVLLAHRLYARLDARCAAGNPIRRFSLSPIAAN